MKFKFKLKGATKINKIYFFLINSFVLQIHPDSNTTVKKINNVTLNFQEIFIQSDEHIFDKIFDATGWRDRKRQRIVILE